MLEAVNTPKAPAAIGPYSQAIITEHYIYTSGQIPLNPITGELISEGIEAETTQVLENLKNILETAGSSLAKVIKTTVFIKEMAHFAIINEIYASYFTPPFPARSCVEVANLPKDVSIEIEAVAIK